MMRAALRWRGLRGGVFAPLLSLIGVLAACGGDGGASGAGGGASGTDGALGGGSGGDGGESDARPGGGLLADAHLPEGGSVAPDAASGGGGEPPPDAGCEAGTLGCACDGDACAEGAFCDVVSALCVSTAACPPGLEGCECLDEACGRTSDGIALTCEAGVCRRPACAPGTGGCACVEGERCLSASDTCVDGFCVGEVCIPGAAGCACLAGGCDPGLLCRGGVVCVDNTGQEGGACLPGGTCARNTRCDRAAGPPTCVGCELGTNGCQCRDDETCGPGLVCAAGLCVGDDTVQRREPPVEPRCYTPCRGDLDDAQRCDAEGLMEGCLAGLACVGGSCVPEGEAAPECVHDADCPDFQICARGACYAECERDAQCPVGYGCQRHVCRLPCSLDRETCPEGQSCEALDGTNGYCQTAIHAVEQTPEPARGTFRLSPRVLEFTNTRLERQVVLRNDGDEPVTFTIRRLEHSALLRDGSTDVRRPIGDEACDAAECPLWWLEVGEFGALNRNRETTIRAPAACGEDCPRLIVRAPEDGLAARRWRGEIQIESPLGTDQLTLSYVETPAGRWAGSLHYYATFPEGGIDGVPGTPGWLDRADRGDVRGVRNGLIQRWGAFRTGTLNGGWSELQAVLTATETDQWRFENVRADCLAPEGACYLFDAGAGARPKVYVTQLQDTPIPTGDTEFPVELNLRIPDHDTPERLTGRVVSSTTLHMPGDPEISLSLASDPTDPRACDPRVRTNCVHFLDGLDFTVVQGGRTAPDADGRCPANFQRRSRPWLVPGFLAATHADADTGLLRADDCVDSRLPWVEEPTAEQQAANLNLATGNPIPDGQWRRRTFELLDGALVDQGDLFVMFRERYPSFLGDDQDLVAYGYMLLRRVPTEIEDTDENADGIPDDYAGTHPPPDLPQPPSSLGVTCSAELLADILGPGVALTADTAPQVVAAILDGASDPGTAPLSPAEDGEEVHYLCVETGLFDGGPGNTRRWGTGSVGPSDDTCRTSSNGRCEDGLLGSTAGTCAPGTDATDCGYRYEDVRTACPADSEVIFFSTDRALLRDLFQLPCQHTASCADQLGAWIDSSHPGLLQVEPTWRCADDQGAFCDQNRLDLRFGKEFFAAGGAGVFDVPLEPAIAEAFRFRARFQSANGRVIGFAPSICEPFSDAVPYCYDPERIEALEGRIDCLASVYQRFYTGPDGPGRPGAAALYQWLEESFSMRTEADPQGGLPRQTPGFERQFAELLIMLGDDAYTGAFESRFDAAGLRAAAFEGAAFETGGIDLSGVAGFEMFQLYQAAQYYNLVLDRFYRLAPVLGASLAAGSPQTDRNFISAEMVTTWFDRVARASTQRAKALGEIARRYQNLGRPDLARAVSERGYAGTYVESVALANLIQRIYDIAGGADRTQLQRALEETQRRYHTALLDLGEVHGAITDELTYFGYPADYIPFPSLDGGGADRNAFDAVLQVVQSRIDPARQREQAAIQNARQFDADAADFQGELTRIVRTYEGQLADLCGTFAAPDGRIHPSIRRYAHLDPHLSAAGDPCGLSGNGALHNAIAAIDLVTVGNRRVATQIRSVLEQIQIEKERVTAHCNLVDAQAQYVWQRGEQTIRMDEVAAKAQQTLERKQRLLQHIGDLVSLAVCEGPVGCVAAAAGAVVKTAAFIAQEEFVKDAEKESIKRQRERAEFEATTSRWVTEQQCDFALVDSNAATRVLMLQLLDADINALENEYQLRLAVAEVVRQKQQARRIEQELEESLQLQIDSQAARNDPNVRIYRNDSVINADVSFQDLLREAYRLTLVYQYYTSQSYARLGDLFLVRTVSIGENNLENYVMELQNAFGAFEERFGAPDVRVQVISLRDHMFGIPRLDADGRALTVDERARRLRARLQDPALLDRNGYLTIPFRTRLEEVSPITRNHKILYVESNIEGNDNGDFLGRLYLRQTGTGVIHTVADELAWYRLPARTAVLNPFFNGTREFANTPEVYRNQRLRDLPLINTSWELVFNQRDEEVNRDIDLGALSDIKLYVYYTDFTSLQ